MRKSMRIPALAAAAALVAASLPALAQVQVPLAGATVPKFQTALPKLSLDPAVPGIQVTLGTAVASDVNFPNGRQDVTVNLCEFTNNILPGVLALPATHVWGYRVGACPATKDTLVGDSYLGPVIVAQRHVPTRVTFVNQLGDTAVSKVRAYKDSTDLTLMWADPLSMSPTGVAQTNPLAQYPYSPITAPGNPGTFAPEDNYCAHQAALNPDVAPGPPCNGNYAGPIASAPHLHGGEIPPVLDGGPDAWWTQNGLYGHGYYSAGGFADSSLGKGVYTYPNVQEASPIWFHDHVLGATRLNVYAGIAGAFPIVDPDPAKLGTAAGALDQNSKLAAGLLPLGLDTNGNLTTDPANDELLIPLVLQDRMFDTTGELFFPAAGFNTSLEHPYWVPEFVGDTIAVNGKTWPVLNVQPKRYRFLVLNGSNARAYELYLVDSGAKTKVKKNGKPSANPTVAGPAIYVIGNDQGYLDAPVPIDPLAKTNNKLVIMPGERYEVIIDFAAFAGLALDIRNTAAIPYPFGLPVVPGLDDTILRINVGAVAPRVDSSYNPALGGAIRLTVPVARLVNPATGTLAAGVTVQKTRRLTLNEFISPVTLAPVELLMNNTKYIGDGNLSNVAGQRVPEFTPVTTRWNTTWYSEMPYEGETEIWEIVNFSADAHPIHPHLVAFQILNRQPFDAIAYQAAYDASFPSGLYEPGAGPPYNYNTSLPAAAAVPAGCGLTPPPLGAYPCVLGGNPDPAPFFLGPAVPPVPAEVGWKDTAISYPGEILRMVVRFAPQDPARTAYDFSPNGGHGYVWHCHIIDHEDNEMMRPFNVLVDAATPRTFVQGVQY